MIQPGAPLNGRAPPPFQPRESDHAGQDSNLRTMDNLRPMLRRPGRQVAQLPTTVYTDTGMDAHARASWMPMPAHGARARKPLNMSAAVLLPTGSWRCLIFGSRWPRGLLWPDVLTVLDDPADVRAGSPETLGRPKWIVAGTAADREGVEIVCVLDTDEHGLQTVFITLYRGGV